jgi:hypothetical protein
MMTSFCFQYKTNKVIVTESYLEEWMYICMDGQCRVIKSLCLDGNEPDDDEESLLKEEEMITAEFLDSMQNSDGSVTKQSGKTGSGTMNKVTRHKL